MDILLIFIGLFTSISLETIKIGLILSSDSPYSETFKEITSLAQQAVNEELTTNDIEIVNESFDEKYMISSSEAACKLVDKGVIAVISTTDSTSTKSESETLARLHIPMVSVAASDPFLHSSSNSDFIITLSPSDMFQSKAIFGIIRNYEWYEFSILASSDTYGINGVLGLLHLQYLVNSESKYKIKQAQYFNSNEEDIVKHLDILEKSLEHIIVLHCSASDAKLVLKIAEKKGLLNKGYVWIVTDAVVNNVRALLENPDSEGYLSYYDGLIGTVPTHSTITDQYKQFKDVYLNKSNAKYSDLNANTLKAYDAVTLIGTAVDKLKKENPAFLNPNVNCKSPTVAWDGGKELYDKLKSTPIQGVSNDVTINDNGEIANKDFDIVNFKNNGFQRVGTWSAENGLKDLETVLFLGGQANSPPAFINKLSGRHIKMSIVAEAPLAYKNQSEECQSQYSKPECWYGFCPEINAKLAEELNFTYEYVEPADNKYGGRNASGDWNGMIGDILSGVSDMTGTALAINIERSQVISFSFPFTEDTSKAIVLGSTESQNHFFFLNAFRPGVWLLIILIIFLLTIIMNFLNKMSPYGKYGNKIYALQTCCCDKCKRVRLMKDTKDSSSLQVRNFSCKVEKVQHTDYMDTLSLYNSLWLIASGFVCQGSESSPKCPSARFLLWAWWFFVMIIVSMYTANITAFLTLKRVGVSINTVKELPSQSRYRWGVIKDRNIQSRLLNHVDKDFKNVVEKGDELDNLESAIDEVKRGGFVFIDEGSVLDYNFKDSCEYITIDTNIESNEWAYGIANYSPYTNVINMKFLEFKEKEFFNQLKIKWYQTDKQCDSSQVGNDTPFDIKTLSGLFYLMAMAVGVSLVLLVGETLHASYKDTTESGKGGTSMAKALWDRLAYKRTDIQTEWGKKNKSEKHISTVTPHKAGYDNKTMEGSHV